ncbi:MAG: methanogen output domain 1-containing protein, partial [Candidatus Odinarchaeia archaeon]
NEMYDYLSISVISNLIKILPEKKLKNIFIDIGNELAAYTINKWIKKYQKINNINQLVNYLNEELEASGISCKVDYNNSSITIKIGNCVFHKAASLFYPNICLIHESFFKRIVEKTLNINVKVNHLNAISKGDSECFFVIQLGLK